MLAENRNRFLNQLFLMFQKFFWCLIKLFKSILYLHSHVIRFFIIVILGINTLFWLFHSQIFFNCFFVGFLNGFLNSIIFRFRINLFWFLIFYCLLHNLTIKWSFYFLRFCIFTHLFYCIRSIIYKWLNFCFVWSFRFIFILILFISIKLNLFNIMMN